ncbi:sporulation histidine kinase inhibitor Sda [Paenibacillus koleovorans]|uniref:sporulation histidine kinase inhibitor Sda n=1 Tax=Paenibacillus koleovorans TaxID=121608 RepID=UPI000FD74AE6|nr:sporulation histidine kinase inhibitor Sda [Paenibacillus koleovorans]
MNKLRDDHLIDVYLQAVEMELDADFIHLLFSEIEKRKLKVNHEHRNLMSL